MDEKPYFIEVHRAGEAVRIYFASEAKFHLKEGRLAADDPAKLADGVEGLRGLADLLKSLPKQPKLTSGHAKFLRSRNFPLWPGMKHAEAHYLIDGGHYWRKKEMTEPQGDFLRKLGVEPFPTMTCGEASDLIDELSGK